MSLKDFISTIWGFICRPSGTRPFKKWEIDNFFYRYFVPLGLKSFEKVPEGRNIGRKNYQKIRQSPRGTAYKKLSDGVKNFFVFSFLLIALITKGQDNTVGLLSIDHDLTIGGYNLIYPERQSDIFLLNKCGEIVHQWEDQPEARPASVAYLLENGNILRSKSLANDPNATFITGGAGGIIELVSWDNEILWTYEVSDSNQLQHHDVHYTPHGTVMIIVWEKMRLDEIVANGFDTISNNQKELWSDYILEVDPTTDDIIWEWHAKDHLIQDYDSTKANYGIVSEHPERININYVDFTFQKTDWLHCNSIDYNPILNQVMLSSKHFNEIWIIDHSTTTAEATGTVGGNSSSGGDLLFRWGNPHAYKMGSVDDQKLFSQHDAQWIDDASINSDYEHFGKIALFNNFIAPQLSLGQILEPVFDSTSFAYQISNGTFSPQSFTEAFSHPDTIRNFSTAASSIQIIGDGHVVMCAGRQGRSFELTPEGELAWEYLTPIKFGNSVPQGFELNLSDNFTFQIQRYLEDYPALIGKDLSPKGFIELEPNSSFCTLVNIEEINKIEEFTIFPNPVQNDFFIENKNPDLDFVQIFDVMGNLILEQKIIVGKNKIESSNWENGVYFIGNSRFSFFQKIIIQD